MKWMRNILRGKNSNPCVQSLETEAKFFMEPIEKFLVFDQKCNHGSKLLCELKKARFHCNCKSPSAVADGFL